MASHRDRHHRDRDRDRDRNRDRSRSRDELKDVGGLNPNADVAQNAAQVATTDQESDELIFVKDSCNITVHSTDTQAAVSLQVALQLAIALVLRITILDTDQGRNVSQELLQFFNSEQQNKQKVWIENSKDINVTTTDTDITANLQAMLEVLAALVVKVDVL